jgi:hypothetical protein
LAKMAKVAKVAKISGTGEIFIAGDWSAAE